MPFNPRVIQPDDGDEPRDPFAADELAIEWELPAEFAGLGQQLASQADRLAESYPAQLPPRLAPALLAAAAEPVAVVPPSPAARRLAVGAAAAALIVMVTVCGWMLGIPSQEVAQQGPPRETARRHAAADKVTAPARENQQAGEAELAAAGTNRNDRDSLASESVAAPVEQPGLSLPVGETPAVIFQEMNSAELEGVLDLLEQQDSGVAQLSI